jgi:hypothetical protein
MSYCVRMDMRVPHDVEAVPAGCDPLRRQSRGPILTHGSRASGESAHQIKG